MAQAVDRETLGAWVLKCNPARWDLTGFRAAGETRITSWAVQPGYRSGLMTPGDRALFWVSGPGRGPLVRGIWGLGHVTAPAEDWVDDDRRFWRDEGGRQGVRGRVPLDVLLLDEPVSDAELKASGVLDLEVQRLPVGANPSFVSTAQLRVLEELLPPWPGFAGGEDGS